MDQHEQWFIDEFWTNYMEPALRGSAAQNSQGQVTALQAQNAARDATNNINTRRAREEQMVQVARDYRGGDEAICTPASILQSMTASKELARGAASNMANAALKNSTGSTDGRSFNGVADDQFRRFEAGLSVYCDGTGSGGIDGILGCSAPAETANLDISYQELIFGRDTNKDGKIDSSDYNFDHTLDADELKHLKEFQANIGLQKTFSNIPRGKASGENMDILRSINMQKREYWARASIAGMSFYNFEGLQSPGTSAAVEYMKGLMGEQGRDTSLISDNPSVYAQQKLAFHDYYADPKYMIEQIGSSSPHIVSRTQAMALTTLNMQMWNIYNVLLRMEQNMAGLNLHQLDDQHQSIQRQIATVSSR
jgi:hypothetical protein